MSNLAKHAIVGGRKVRLEGALPESEETPKLQESLIRYSELYDRLISEAGASESRMQVAQNEISAEKSVLQFKQISIKVLQQGSSARFNEEEICFLARNASIPFLMQLVQARNKASHFHESRFSHQSFPLLVIPLQTWLGEALQGRNALADSDSSARELQEILPQVLCRIKRALEGLPQRSVRLVIEEVDWQRLINNHFLSLFEEIKSYRKGIILQAPPIDRVWADWRSGLLRHGHSPRALDASLLFSKLQQHGFDGFRGLCGAHSIKLTQDRQDSNCIFTEVALLNDPAKIASELKALDELFDDPSVTIWIPGSLGGVARHNSPLSEKQSPENWASRAMREVKILRVLALGALLLPARVERRASTRFLSHDALALASYCGATEYAFESANSELTSPEAQNQGHLGLKSYPSKF